LKEERDRPILEREWRRKGGEEKKERTKRKKKMKMKMGEGAGEGVLVQEGWLKK
jgi:hypothetical protein